MNSPSAPVDYDDFRQWVRQAARNLYDSPSLGRGPLADLFASEGHGELDRAQYLRRLILETIDAIQPEPGTPAQSPDWRGYRILELRYVEGLDPDEVMEHLGLQKSQYFADQARSLQALTDRLWEHYQASMPSPGESTDRADAGSSRRMVHEETARLAARAEWDEVDASVLLKELGALVLPLARERRIAVQMTVDEPVRVRQASRILLRQAVLAIILYSLDVAPGGSVEIGTFREAHEAGVCVRAHPVLGASGRAGAPPDAEGRLALCQQWMATLNGTLRIEGAPGSAWTARLAWAIQGHRTLLVIDDNHGFLELFRRYLAEHDWRVVGASSGAQARDLITTMRPTAIILDVLMPQEDGWEVLVSLRTNQATRDTPIIVCSVLNESQLALSLGASAYLVKPVTEESLLRALAPWVGPTATPAPGC